MAWVIGIGVVLFLLFAFPKQMGAVLLLLLAVGGGVLGWIFYSDSQRLEEYKRIKESVSMSATFDAVRCSTEFPIIIKINNRHTETLISVSFGISGFREGYSAPVYKASYLTSDRIISPGQSYETCWAVPSLVYGAAAAQPETLNWKAESLSPTFGSPP